MRMRNKKNADARILACNEIFASDSESLRSFINVKKVRGMPLYLEIGCGKGTFICETAMRNPDAVFIALEKEKGALVIAIEKAYAAKVSNICFIFADAVDLREYFHISELDGIYLNFSDPWIKRWQHNRRLTHSSFIDVYKAVLKPNAFVKFKTDNRSFFDFSLNSFVKGGFAVEDITYDLHNSPYAIDNVQTEYENRFAGEGIPICSLAAYFNKTSQ